MSETTFHLGFRNSWKQLDMSIGCWNNHLSVGHVFGQFWWQWDHFCENLKFRKSGLRLSSTERSVKIRQIISTVCLFYKNGRDGKWQAPRDCQLFDTNCIKIWLCTLQYLDLKAICYIYVFFSSSINLAIIQLIELNIYSFEHYLSSFVLSYLSLTKEK